MEKNPPDKDQGEQLKTLANCKCLPYAPGGRGFIGTNCLRHRQAGTMIACLHHNILIGFLSIKECIDRADL